MKSRSHQQPTYKSSEIVLKCPVPVPSDHFPAELPLELQLRACAEKVAIIISDTGRIQNS
eukprot:174498-Prorocentrum_minimum.AAC.2